MLFSSVLFIFIFLPIVLIVYYLFLRKSRKAQNIFLLIASLLFYAWGEPKFVLVMMLSITVNFAFGLWVDKYKKAGDDVKSKWLMVFAVVFNVLILFIFKYLNFATDSIFKIIGIDSSIPKIALPIGISFFTFQAMSYVFDVYYNKAKVQKSILNVGLYISFFPQLIAGPIVRYQTIADQIENRKENMSDFARGFERFIIGLAKKVLIANSVALVADIAFDKVADGGAISVAMAWLGAICYTFQIFFDFSGYSDMAIGLGSMFGFHFLENFNYPYISTSVSEFWRRWHISMGSWFRDYVYIPLGGSRKGNIATIRNLFIVWLLTGLWHGANWTFVLWGLMYFVLIAFERITGWARNSIAKSVKPVCWIYTIFFVVMGWVMFRSDNLTAAADYFKCMFGIGSKGVIDGLFFTELKSVRIHIVLAVLFSIPIVPWLQSKIKAYVFTDIIVIAILAILFVLSIASIVGTSYNPFIYFNF